MKELSLSLLSRGCGRELSSEDNTEGCVGRLDVCFTPNDYYLWKSQESLLRLTSSGRLVSAAQSGLPKTYSTRRGPLLLYSQDLVTVKRNVKVEAGNKKKRLHCRHTQHVQKQLSNLKELTTAILSYSNSQNTPSRPAPSLYSPLHFPSVHFPTPLPLRSPRAQPDPAWFVPMNLQWLPSWNQTELQENSADKTEMFAGRETELENRNIIRLDVFLQTASPSRSPSPQAEPEPWVHYVATAAEPEDTETYLDMSFRQTEGSSYTDRRRRSTEDIQGPNFSCVQDTVRDEKCSVWSNSGRNGERVSHERVTSGNRLERKGLFLPPLREGIFTQSEKERRQAKMRWKNSGEAAHSTAQHFSQIRKNDFVASAKDAQDHIYSDEQTQAEGPGFHFQENLHRVNEQPIILPPLFHEKEEPIRAKMRGEKENTDRECVKNPTAGQGAGGGRRKMSFLKGPKITLEPDNEPALVGLMDSGPGLKGLGRQSSMAYLQNRLLQPRDPQDAANRGVVKGLLPLELRDLESSKPVGCLILGPDGEIIQLSLYDNSQERGQGDDDTLQQQALQVLSPEGETLPWVVMLQPEVTPDAEAEVEDNPGVMEENQPIYTVTEDNTSVSEFAAVQSTSDEACREASAVSPTNQRGAGTQERTEAGFETRKTGKDARNGVRMPGLREGVGSKESQGGHCEAEEVKEGEDEKSDTGESGHLTGSHQERNNGQIKDTSPTETTTNETVDGRRTNIKRKDDEETAVTSGKRDLKIKKSRELEGPRSSRRDKEGGRQQKKTERNSRGTRSQKPDERTNKKAGDAPGSSALPAVASVENAVRDRQGRIKEVKMNEEGDSGGGGRGGEGAVAMLKEASAGRKKRRKGRLTQKDAADEENHNDAVENKELETKQKMEEDSLQKSSKNVSLTQNDDCEMDLKSEEDSEIDHLSNFDDRRSIRSVSPLRSSAAASQFNLRNMRRSATSSCEGTLAASVVDLASARGRLSSCSAVTVMDEQLMLNTTKPEVSAPRMNQEETAALRRAQRAERRRQEVERKRREQEEEERKQQEREQMEERMKNELEEERRRRAEELRLKMLAEEEERKRREDKEQARLKQEQAEKESERRRQEDRRRQMARLKKLREEEDQRRKAELERMRLDEQRRQEEENVMLQEMDESERKNYLSRKEQEEEENRKREEEQKRREEEAALRAAEEARLEAGRLLREMALLQQHLSFKRTFDLEAGGLEKTQGISRPWVFSYFSLLQLMGLSPSAAEPTI